ncbi:hypothetical protein ACCUM_0143 [Candidatus Accumulibacter phosphatis]|uniref:Uncharacterized protein n=2 Tax=Candidatus Accumulibacter TaxID=327159 RepID=A0A080MEM0_9PROT|nr:MAG: hypothetical protein AW06_003306 [Candidatus Accumulibacter cognatus]TMQ76085.1 hypothetical protein ACCUM_0143 [Candidatus Accumulibacter phosphatis]
MSDRLARAAAFAILAAAAHGNTPRCLPHGRRVTRERA